MPRLYRKQTDSSTFTEPRVLARVFAEPGLFEQTVRRYEQFTGARLDMDLDVRELGIRIAAVGAFLVLELDPALLDRAGQARRTPVTMIFSHLDQAISRGLALGSELVEAPFPVPTGRGARLRHPDGLLVEYLEHRPSPHDVDTPAL
ncbi:VOC family protein [Streptomyces sp. 8L]|uniref:VOC family protein n=1 Tax=Streptomyces sp. 8L TaxID=2877242 RepID=UPI001CD507BA|nr:hypothetical protein [Streptomyces sp. 8L]MCA1223927.1 hypothetical protein [Streptomyces sp. 8L]